MTSPTVPYADPGSRDATGQSAVAAVTTAHGYDGIDTGLAVGAVDTDHDGLTDAFEKLAGTNPVLADTDGDGLTDGFELMRAATPTHSPPTPTRTASRTPPRSRPAPTRAGVRRSAG